MASQNQRKKLRRFIQLSNQSTYIFASFCKAMLATQSLLNPKKQIVDRWITGWSPSDLRRAPSSVQQHKLCLFPFVRTLFSLNYNENTKESAWFLLKTLKLFVF